MIDTGTDFCQAAYMIRLPRRFIATLLAIWLPLFGGNALAASVVIQTMSGDCHAMVAQSSEHHSQHFQLVAKQHKPAGHDDQQNSSCKDCGVCYFSCCGYMATVSINVVKFQPLAHTFTLSSTQFQSVTLPLFDPPPITRA